MVSNALYLHGVVINRGRKLDHGQGVKEESCSIAHCVQCIDELPTKNTTEGELYFIFFFQKSFIR
jgi:hypothetical protein